MGAWAGLSVGVEPKSFRRPEPASTWVVIGAEENQGDQTGDSQRLLYVPYRRSPPHPPRPLPSFAPLVKVEPQSPVKQEEEEPTSPGDLDQEPSLLYADLDHSALRRPRWLSTTVPGDASTVYAVVV